MPIKWLKSSLLIVAGFAVGGVCGFMLSHQMAVSHWFAPSQTEKQSWISTISAAKSIAVTRIKDNKTIIIEPEDKRFKGIIDGTIHSIKSEDHNPAMGPISVVVYRTPDSGSVVAVYTGKHIVIQGYYFMTPYALAEFMASNP